ncbi:MAG: hypothetical protein KGI91_16155 [Burkholderiales bacterium]|nr:hypothetical protein [Burkholderiales bacterium]
MPINHAFELSHEIERLSQQESDNKHYLQTVGDELAAAAESLNITVEVDSTGVLSVRFPIGSAPMRVTVLRGDRGFAVIVRDGKTENFQEAPQMWQHFKEKLADEILNVRQNLNKGTQRPLP